MKNFRLLMLFMAVFFSGPVSSLYALDLTEPKPEQPTGFLEEIPDWQARLELARLLSYTEQYEESAFQYKKVIQEKPDLLEARLELARVLYWKGDASEAEKMFASVPRENLPDSALLELADLYVAREDYGPALEIYQNYLKTSPEDVKVRFKLAQVLSWQGDYDSSIRQYEQVLKARPADIQVRRKYAQVLIWAERFEDAIKQLEQTLAD